MKKMQYLGHLRKTDKKIYSLTMLILSLYHQFKSPYCVMHASTNTAAPSPNSGCYFSNEKQVNYWVKESWLLDRDIRIVDPMASAATWGITRTFRVYKPAMGNASFLEIENCDQRYLW